MRAWHAKTPAPTAPNDHTALHGSTDDRCDRGTPSRRVLFVAETFSETESSPGAESASCPPPAPPRSRRRRLLAALAGAFVVGRACFMTGAAPARARRRPLFAADASRWFATATRDFSYRCAA
jgi:hypothetical protein